MHARHARVLAELADAGMVMVRELSEAMSRSRDAAVQVQLGLAFHRASRAVRLTLALEFRLAQEARRPPPPQPAAAPPVETAATTPPTARVRAERPDWLEYERAESEDASDELDALLEADEVDLATVHEAIEASVARTRRDIAPDPLLVKAGVLAPAPAPTAAGPPRAGPHPRRSALLGAAAFGQAPLGATRPLAPLRAPTIHAAALPRAG